MWFATKEPPSNGKGILSVGLVVGLLFPALVGARTVVCYPDVPGPRDELTDGARYYATGGIDPNHDSKGADRWRGITVKNWYKPRPAGWEKVELPFETTLFHNGDWALYHFKTAGTPLEVIELCLKGTGTPGFSPVRVFAHAGPFVQVDPTIGVALHDEDVSPVPRPTQCNQGQKQVWIDQDTLFVPNDNLYRLFTIDACIPPDTEYYVAVRLREQPPKTAPNTNVTIAWIKLIL